MEGSDRSVWSSSRPIDKCVPTKPALCWELDTTKRGSSNVTAGTVDILREAGGSAPAVGKETRFCELLRMGVCPGAFVLEGASIRGKGSQP